PGQSCVHVIEICIYLVIFFIPCRRNSWELIRVSPYSAMSVAKISPAAKSLWLEGHFILFAPPVASQWYIKLLKKHT
ncbi:hypothetical protein, partial [Acetomicrobium sp. S15 = DSM 107314]|uniref:hypothetical protein n=1 Tax=Acetomicrobium sp. S15 = DSM 107314 TaxID=2529858 RepID=UPI001E2E21E9